MEMAIVSVQGFKRKEEFTIKVILGDNERLVHYIFTLPFPWSNLNDEDRRL